MSLIESFCAYLEQTDVAMSMAQSPWLFPVVESLHVIALVLVVGSISMIDLRLLGLTLPQRNVAELTRELLPWTWSAFAVAAVTGSLLFASAATKYIVMLPLILKFMFMAAAGINMAIFHFLPYRRVSEWGSSSRVPFGAKLAGGLSLIFWIGVVACGRWIGFV